MLSAYIVKHKQPFDEVMIQLIQEEEIPTELKQSMLYSLSVGGKRIRPLLVFAVLEALGHHPQKGYKVAAALEMIHTYSLIHDDLPAMDDDELRRGKPTNHIVYGQATAILAGDSLLTHAFKVIAEDHELTMPQRVQLVLELSKAAGPMGMVAGQILDMEAEEHPVTLEQLKQIHTHKTGRLIEFAIVAGALISEASETTIQTLRQFAYHIGLAFQIKDDILDVEGNPELIGKKVGSDVANGKSTYVSLTSLQQAKEMLADEILAAQKLLENLPGSTELLKAITQYIQERQA